MLDQARDHYRMRRYEEVLKVITNNNNTAAVQQPEISFMRVKSMIKLQKYEKA